MKQQKEKSVQDTKVTNKDEAVSIKSSKPAFVRVIVITSITLIIAIILENVPCFGGEFLSEFFGAHLRAHDDGEIDGIYVLYYIILYLGLILYISFTLYICVKRDTKGWCALCILISVIFLIAVDEWLSITLQYEDGEKLYDKHMLCYICVATIISGVSAAKLSGIIRAEQESKTALGSVSEKKNNI